MQIINWRTVSSIPASLRTPAIVSSALVLPFVILELANRPGGEFPIALFVVMWVVPLLFVLILTPILQYRRPRKAAVANVWTVWLRVAVLLVLAWFWVSLTVDQMPCFLGVPNCD